MLRPRDVKSSYPADAADRIEALRAEMRSCIDRRDQTQATVLIDRGRRLIRELFGLDSTEYRQLLNARNQGRTLMGHAFEDPQHLVVRSYLQFDMDLLAVLEDHVRQEILPIRGYQIPENGEQIRQAILRALEQSDLEWTSSSEIADHLGVGQARIERQVELLLEAGHVQVNAGGLLKITAEGLQSLEAPNDASQVQQIQVIHGNVYGIGQQAGEAEAELSFGNVDQLKTELSAIRTILRQTLPDQMDRIEEAADVIEEELAKDMPTVTRLREALGTVADVASLGSLAMPQLAPHLASLISRVAG